MLVRNDIINPTSAISGPSNSNDELPHDTVFELRLLQIDHLTHRPYDPGGLANTENRFWARPGFSGCTTLSLARTKQRDHLGNHSKFLGILGFSRDFEDDSVALLRRLRVIV